MALNNFLDTKHGKDELRATLAVVREFKACESGREWLELSFSTWYVFKLFEDMLEHLVEGKPLTATLTHIAHSSGV